jgi:hypothetical protein
MIPDVLAWYHFRLNCGSMNALGGGFLFQAALVDGGAVLRQLYTDFHHARGGDRPAVV